MVEMKKQFAILLLLCYSLALIKPLVPAVSDFVSHTYWKSEHLATVHFENGKYHLHIDMEKAGKHDQQNDPKKISEKNQTVHLKTAFATIEAPVTVSNVLPACKQEIHSDFLPPVSSPPPKA